MPCCVLYTLFIICVFAGAVALELYTALTNLQLEKAEDPFGWVSAV